MTSRRRRLRTITCSCPDDFYDELSLLKEPNETYLSYQLIKNMRNVEHFLLRSYVRNEDRRILFIVDDNNRILEVSNAWCKTCGYTHKEAYDMSFKQLQGFETCHKSIAKFLKVLETDGHAKMDIINYSKENERLDLLVSAVSLDELDDVYPLETPRFICEAFVNCV